MRLRNHDLGHGRNRTAKVYWPIWAAVFSLVSAPLFASSITKAGSGAVPADSVGNGSSILTLDDALRIRTIGNAAISADGGYFAYEIGISAEDMGNSCYRASGFDDRALYVARTDDMESIEITGAGSDKRYSLIQWQEPFSPDANYIALREATCDANGFAIWDVRHRRAEHLPGTAPGYWGTSAWTPDGRFIYATAPENAGWLPGKKLLKQLTQRWEASWSGLSAQVTVASTNPLMKPTTRALGALMVASPSEGSHHVLANGDYHAIKVSADGQLFAVVGLSNAGSGERGKIGQSSPELQIFRLTRTGAALEARFENIDVPNASGLAWSPNERELLVAAQNSSDSKLVSLYRYDVQTRSLSKIESGDLSFADPSVGNGATLATMPIGWLGSIPLAIASQPSQPDKQPDAGPIGSGGLDYGEFRDKRFDLWTFPEDGPRNLTAFARASTLNFADPPGHDAAYAIADGALWKIPLHGAAERLTSTDGPTVAGFALPRRYLASPMREAFAPVANGSATVQLLLQGERGPQRANFDLNARRFAPSEQGTLLARSQDLSKAVISQKSYSDALFLRTGDQLRKIVTLNAQLEGKVAGAVVKISYRFGGEELTAWAIKPPNAPERPRAPTIVVAYGGNVWGSQPPVFANIDSPFPVFNGQLMAAQGYVVLYPSLPLKAGADHDLPQMLAEATIAAIDAAAKQGLVNPDRVAVMGQSFGGYSTAAILARHSERFRAGVALAGIYDWIWGYGVQSPTDRASGNYEAWLASGEFIEQSQPGLRRPPWVDIAPYLRNSPFFDVTSIDTPLMMMHGDLDTALTSLEGAERMYAALLRAGKQPVLVRYWGEGHVVSGAANVRDQWGRIMDWFGMYLRGE